MLQNEEKIERHTMISCATSIKRIVLYIELYVMHLTEQVKN